MSAWQSTQLRESQHDLSVHTAFWTRRKRPACRHGSPPSFESPSTAFLFSELSGLCENAWASQACRVFLGTSGSDSLTVLTVVMGKKGRGETSLDSAVVDIRREGRAWAKRLISLSHTLEV